MSSSTKYDVGIDTRINVVSSGTQDPTLIFLHFWGGSSNTYGHLIQHLSTRFRCIGIDFRGWGESSGPQRPDKYTMQDLATDVEELVTLLRLESFILIGHSMGGKVAQLVAGRGYVNGIKGMVLIGPAPPCSLELPPDMRDTQLSAYSNHASAESAVRNVLSSVALSEEIISNLVHDMMKGNGFAKAAWPAYGMSEDITAECKSIEVPVLVIGGELDKVEPRERLITEVIGNIKKAKLVMIHGSGHLMPVEAPLEVSHHIKEFIGTLLEFP